MELIALRAGKTRLTIAPAAGGSIARFWTELHGRAIDWMRPTPAAAVARRGPLDMACFPLVPYSGRIRNGRFRFQDRDVVLPLNFLPEAHSIHGHGWVMPWRVVRAEAGRTTLEYRHPADDWPWTYQTSQDFILEPSRLTLEMTLTNEGPGAMPAGLGPHPYFVRTPMATVTAGVGGMWLSDSETMPTELLEPPAERDFTTGVRVDAVAMDNCFSSWDRKAVIEWPEWNARLTMTADSPLDFLVVYTPSKQDFFCAEPVSHAPDAVNGLSAGRTDMGLQALDEGETMRAIVRFNTECL